METAGPDGNFCLGYVARHNAWTRDEHRPLIGCNILGKQAFVEMGPWTKKKEFCLFSNTISVWTITGSKVCDECVNCGPVICLQSLNEKK